MTKSEHDLRRAYRDLPIEDDPVMLRVVRDLDAAYRRPQFPHQTPPAMLDAHVSSGPAAVPMALVPHAVEASTDRPVRPWRGFGRFTHVVTALGVALLAVSVALAAQAITNLGKPTGDVPDFGPPIGGFHYIKTSLTKNLRPEVLFLSVPEHDSTDAETWPLVKALVQFGTFSGLSALPPLKCRCAPPGFELSRAVYRSRYVALVSREIDDVNGKPFQRLDRTQLSLFNRFSNPHDPGPKDYFSQAGDAANNMLNSRRLPLVAIAGYLQTESNVLYGSDFVAQGDGPQSGSSVDVSFDDVQASLARGKAVADVEPFLIRDVNIETNIFTALICHADHGQPGKVCGRVVIKRILRQVR